MADRGDLGIAGGIIFFLLIGGAILVSIGVLGEYIGRIFEAGKERPLYIIASKVDRAQPMDLDVPAQLAFLSSKQQLPERMTAEVSHSHEE